MAIRQMNCLLAAGARLLRLFKLFKRLLRLTDPVPVTAGLHVPLQHPAGHRGEFAKVFLLWQFPVASGCVVHNADAAKRAKVYSEP